MLHCTNDRIALCYPDREDTIRRPAVGFFSRLFARPHPEEPERFRKALAVLEAMTPADRADIGIKPADFAQIAEEMARRRQP